MFLIVIIVLVGYIIYTILQLYSVKRSDVTRWKQGYITPPPHNSFFETQWRHSVKTRLIKNPPPYFIVLASSVKTKEAVIEFRRISGLWISVRMTIITLTIDVILQQ